MAPENQHKGTWEQCDKISKADSKRKRCYTHETARTLDANTTIIRSHLYDITKAVTIFTLYPKCSWNKFMLNHYLENNIVARNEKCQ